MMGLGSGVKALSSRAGRKCGGDAGVNGGRTSWIACSRSSDGVRWGRGSYIRDREAERDVVRMTISAVPR